MSLVKPIDASVIEDADAIFMARIKAASGNNIQQSDLSEISVKVFDLDDDDEETYSSTLVISDTDYDALQTDSKWEEDDTGYNFQHTMPKDAFPTGDHCYRIEYKFTPLSGNPFYALFNAKAVNLKSS